MCELLEPKKTRGVDRRYCWGGEWISRFDNCFFLGCMNNAYFSPYTPQKSRYSVYYFLGKSRVKGYPIGLERVYILEASDPEKNGGFYGISHFPVSLSQRDVYVPPAFRNLFVRCRPKI